MGNYATVDDLKRYIGIHVPQFQMLPKPHPRWDGLPSDVRTLLRKHFEVSPQNRHLVFWENHQDPKHRWRSFVHVHLPEMGWDVARAQRALARAVEMRLAVRPNVHGGPLWWEGVGFVWGDWVYLTALGDKLVRRAPREPAQPAVEGEWSAPMTRAEMARRITGQHAARVRKVQGLLDRFGLEQIGGKMFRVRIDKMDTATRKRIEAAS